MGSMADVNTPEKTLEANEGVNQVTGVPVVVGTLPEVAGEHAAMPDPKSPPAGKGDKPDEADVEILELPGSDRKREKSPEIERGDVKRLCATLETQLPSVLEKLHEGYKLTAESLEAVKERTALDKQMQKDLSELARSHGSEHISQKYFLSIMQENLKRAENLEWQVGGPKGEANTSLKSISNKILGAQTATKEGLKALHGEMREGNERVVQAITDGFSKLTAAMVANAPTCERSLSSSISSGATTDHATRNTSCRILSDIHVRSSWICIQLWYAEPKFADTQCADIQCADGQHPTDTGRSGSDFDGVNGKYLNWACCCCGCQK